MTAILAAIPPNVLAAIPAPPSSTLELGPLTIRFYGLMIAFGVIAAVTIAARRWEARGGHPDDISSIAIWAVPAGLVGARLYHVITDNQRYRDAWLEAVKIWRPGLGIPGGLLLGVSAGVWVAHKRGIRDINGLLAAAIPAIPVAQAIGRLGNWFNQEIFGPPSDLPWALRVDPEFRPAQYAENETFHPAFLYEGLFNLCLAAVLIFLDARRWLKPGQMVPTWIFGYGVGRFLVEAIRTDAATEIFGIRVNHWISGTAVVVGIIWFVWAGRRADRMAATAATTATGADGADGSDTTSGPRSADGAIDSNGDGTGDAKADEAGDAKADGDR